MGILIAGELFVLSLAMETLSGVRAFVAGESLWSKAQKDAVIHLQRFAETNDEAQFQKFLQSLEVPEGDHMARLELLKAKPDMEVITRGFQQGHVPLADIPPMVNLIRRFHWVTYISRAVDYWTRGDQMLARLEAAGLRLHEAVRAGDREQKVRIEKEIEDLDVQLTDLENGFSYALGEGSRWVESVVFSVLFMLVLTVEFIGLGLTILTTRALSRGLRELDQAAREIGRGKFKRKVQITSDDELGKLGASVNQMADLLEGSYAELEARVEQRTAELSKLAEENARLYAEAKEAVKMRDEFLSIASHELKTPVSALQLELQLLTRMSRKGDSGDKVIELSSRATRSSRRLSALLDELLDLTRIRLGKLEIHREPGDLAAVVRDVAGAFATEAQSHRCRIQLDVPESLKGSFDSMRITQILGNLFSNAIKYAPGTRVDVNLEESDGTAVLTVADQGPGVPLEIRGRIFDRLERGSSDSSVSGLGLGLYIARQLIEGHGGSIRVEGEPGHGARFVVTLPLKEVAANSA